MKINYDPKKNEKNIRERGLSFDRAVDLDFATASYFLRESAEVRRIVVGYLDKRLHEGEHEGGKEVWQSKNH